MEGISAALWLKEGNDLLAGSGLRGLRAALRGKTSEGVKMAGIRVLAGMVDGRVLAGVSVKGAFQTECCVWWPMKRSDCWREKRRQKSS